MASNKLRQLKRVSRDERLGPEPITVPFEVFRKYILEIQENIDLRIVVQHLLNADLLTQDEAYTLTNPNYLRGDRLRALIEKGRELSTTLLRWVIEHGITAGGHSYLDKLLSGVSRPTEQIINSKKETKSIQRMVSKKRIRFATLVKETWKKLEDTCETVEDELKLFICAFPISCAVKRAILKAKGMREMFDVLNNSCWSYEDPFLLESIIKEFCDPSMCEKMSEYSQKLQDELGYRESSSNFPVPFDKHKDKKHEYARLVRATHKDFCGRQIEITDLRVYSAMLPTVLPVCYSHLDEMHIAAIEDAKMSTLLAIILGFYCDYKGYQLLQCLVNRFGSPLLKQEVKEYADVFIKAMPECTVRLSQAKQEAAQLKENFAEIVIKFLNFLQKKTTITPLEFMDYVSSLPASEAIPEKKIAVPMLVETDSWCTLFIHLAQTWDFLNCRILQNVLKKYGNDELNHDLAMYLQRLLSFLKQTLPTELMEILPSRQPPAKVNYTKVTFVSSSSRWEEDNMLYFDTFVHSLATEFCLHPHTLIIYNTELIKPMSRLHFYLPTSVVGLLLIVNTEEKASFYHRNKILYVELHEDTQFYFDFHLTKNHPKDMLTQACRNQDLDRRLQLSELKAKLEKIES